MQRDEAKGFFTIDKYRLDEEWCKHSQAFSDFAYELADAKKTLEEAKAELDVVDANLDLAIRTNPDEYEVLKVTDKSIEQAIIRHSKHQKALQRVLDAKHLVDVCEVAVKTMEHKKKALEDVVRLRLSDYFAEPKAKGEMAREKIDEMKMQARKRDSMEHRIHKDDLKKGK